MNGHVRTAVHRNFLSSHWNSPILGSSRKISITDTIKKRVLSTYSSRLLFILACFSFLKKKRSGERGVFIVSVLRVFFFVFFLCMLKEIFIGKKKFLSNDKGYNIEESCRIINSGERKGKKTWKTFFFVFPVISFRFFLHLKSNDDYYRGTPEILPI